MLSLSSTKALIVGFVRVPGRNGNADDTGSGRKIRVGMLACGSNEDGFLQQVC